MMFTVSLILLGLGLAYFLLSTLVDLFPLNNIRSATAAERRSEATVNTVPLLIPIVLVVLTEILQLPVLGFIGGTIELVVAVAGISLWWAPYLFNVNMPWATAGTETSWAELHARTYANTIIVMPRIGDRPRPNLEHMILHSLLLAAGICTLIYAAGV